MQQIVYRPIGLVHSPFKSPKGTPIQPAGAEGIDGFIEIFPEFEAGLADLQGFSHIMLIYHFHLATCNSLKVKPFMDVGEHGIFAVRSPARPNPIGLSVVRLLTIDNNILRVQDVDIVDGTPLLDIKPYVPEIDARNADRIGWLEKNLHKLPTTKDDGRFST